VYKRPSCKLTIYESTAIKAYLVELEKELEVSRAKEIELRKEL